MFEQTFKNIDDVLWKDVGRASELDCTEQCVSVKADKVTDAALPWVLNMSK